MRNLPPMLLVIGLGMTSCGQSSVPFGPPLTKEIVSHLEDSLSELTIMTYPSPRQPLTQSSSQIAALSKKHMRLLHLDRLIPLPKSLSIQELGPLCGTASGDMADADEDGVAANATINWSCEYNSDAGRIRISGSSYERDDTPIESFGAFSYGKQGFRVEYLKTQQVTTSDAEVSVAKDFNSYEILAREDISSTDINTSGSSFDISASYVPVDPADPMYSGNMILEGSGSLVYQKSESDFHLDGDVTVTRDCSSGIFDGQISTTANHTNTLTVYKECEAVW